MKNKKRNLIICATGSIFIFALFFYITSKTPLAGDDWGYALSGMKMSPWQATWDFYFSWSGRVFSELWGFLVAPRKWIWNILNPLFFTLIFTTIYRLINPNKNQLTFAFLVLAIMLSVDDNLRMETYTWIMGTTYVIPLMLSLFYFILVERILYGRVTKKKIRFYRIASNILLFYIGLTMENIAAAMVGGTIILTMYCWFKQKDMVSLFLLNGVVSLASFLIMRLSPGSAWRLNHEHVAWMKMGLIEKLQSSYPKFIEFTFLNNNYMIGILALVLSLFLAQQFFQTKNSKLKFIAAMSLMIQVTAVFTVFAFVLSNPWIHAVFTRSDSLFNSLFWIVYIVDLFVVIGCFTKEENREKLFFVLLIAGGSNLVMLVSPIFGSRSSLYTVYYIIVLLGFILKELKSTRIINSLLILFFAVIVVDRTHEYLYKYKLVEAIQQERLAIYEYYRHNPQAEEAWIPRMPPFSIHSADIEEDDTYHFDVFREYYKLTQKKIIFFWKEEGYE